MKNVILSADGESKIYSVPDEVADKLWEYSMEFCTKWITSSPDAEKYRTGEHSIYFDETDFIEYLNKFVFPNQKSTFVKNIVWGGEELPEYKDYPYFNFWGSKYDFICNLLQLYLATL